MNNPPRDLAFLRGLTQSRTRGGSGITRRDVFRVAGASAAALTLAACGVQGKKVAAAPSKDAVASYWAGKKKNGVLRFANWPLYIDKHG